MVARQDARIADLVRGRTVLEVGAGYGALTKRLGGAGFQVTGIDPHRESRARALEWFGVELLDRDIYASGLPTRGFDTVVLREVGEHLDLPVVAPEPRGWPVRRSFSS